MFLSYHQPFLIFPSVRFSQCNILFHKSLFLNTYQILKIFVLLICPSTCFSPPFYRFVSTSLCLFFFFITLPTLSFQVETRLVQPFPILYVPSRTLRFQHLRTQSPKFRIFYKLRFCSSSFRHISFLIVRALFPHLNICRARVLYIANSIGVQQTIEQY